MNSKPTPEEGTSQEAPPPPSNRKRGVARASMRDELLALFRDNERCSSLPSGALWTTGMAKSSATEPSRFLRRFLQRTAPSPELAPSGLASLDSRLAGGFGPGLHLVLGPTGVGKTAFLESMVWEAVSDKRPVLYYALKEGSLRTWERLISTVGHVLDGRSIPVSALRARTLAPQELETLARLDLALQSAVLPYLSLVDTVSASTPTLSAFIQDVRLRAQEAMEQHQRIPLLLVDDLERLRFLTGSGPLLPLLSRLDGTLTADSVPGLLAATTPDPSLSATGKVPVQTIVVLESVSALAGDAVERVDLDLRTNAPTGWAETLPLLLDRRTGLFTDPSTCTELDPM